MNVATAIKTCTFPDCDGKHYGRGFCEKHYMRWHRYGDPSLVKKRGDRGKTGWGARDGHRQPMNEWERRQVTSLLAQGLSYRRIQASTGINYATVCRFAKKLRTS